MFFSAGRLVKFLTGYGAIGTMLAIISVTEPVLSAIVLNGLCVVIALHIALPVAAIAGGGMSALLGFRVFSIHLSSAPVRQRRIAGVAFAYGGPPFGAAVTFAGRSTKALRLRILLSMFAGFLTCIALATSALALSHGRGLLDLPTRVAPAGSFAMAAILLTIPSLEQMLNVARAK